MKKLLLQSFHLVSILYLVYICYRESLSHQFTFDDHLAIEQNQDVTHQPANETVFEVIMNKNGHSIWLNDIWGKDLTSHDSHKSFRPLLIIVFRRIWSFASNLGATNKAYYFRYVSLVIHSAVSLFIYFYSARLLFYVRCKLLNSKQTNEHYHLAFAVAAFFASHPIHIEAVTAVVNISESMSTLFVLLANSVFLLSLPKDNESLIKIFLKTSISTCLFLVISTIAILFKESGLISAVMVLSHVGLQILFSLFSAFVSKLKRVRLSSSPIKMLVYSWWTSVALLLIYYYFMFRSILTHPSKREQILTNAKEFFHYMVTFLWNSSDHANYLQVTADRLNSDGTTQGSKWINHLIEFFAHNSTSAIDTTVSSNGLIRRAENPFIFLQGPSKIVSMLYLYFRYFALLVLPKDQSPEYSFNCIPAITSINDRRIRWIAAMFLFFASWVAVGLQLLKRSVLYHERTHVNEMRTKNIDMIREESRVLSQHFYDYSYSLFYALLWMVIAFLPASGIFFTLGTLLAERLLYLPSFGYCILLALLLHTVSNLLIHGKVFLIDSHHIEINNQSESVIVDDSERSERDQHQNEDDTPVTCHDNDKDNQHDLNQSQDDSNQESEQDMNNNHESDDKPVKNTPASRLLSIALFYALVIGVVSYYCQQARYYNQYWKSDEALFRYTLTVCPNSAKTNLQVSKLYSYRLQNNHHHDQSNIAKYSHTKDSTEELSESEALELAWKHLQRAQEIDPGFCDTGYQEALLLLARARLHEGSEYDQFREDLEDMLRSERSKLRAEAKSISEYVREKEQQFLLDDSRLSQQLFQRAITATLRNLKCVYSNRGSLELLTKLWQHEVAMIENLLQQNENNNINNDLKNKYTLNYVAIIARQAKLAAEFELPGLAVKKFVDIAVMSYNLMRYSETLDYLYRARKALLRSIYSNSVQNTTSFPSNNPRIISNKDLINHLHDFFNEKITENVFHSDEKILLRVLLCKVNALFAVMRNGILQHFMSQKDKSNNDEQDWKRSMHSLIPQKQLQRLLTAQMILEDLKGNINAECTILSIITTNKDIQQNTNKNNLQLEHVYRTSVVTTTNLLAARLVVTNVTQTLEYTRILTNALAFQYLYDSESEGKSKQEREQLAYYEDQVFQLWRFAGRSAYLLKDFQRAMEYYSMAILANIFSNTQDVDQRRTTGVRGRVLVEGLYSLTTDLSDSLLHNSTFKDKNVTCYQHVLFWNQLSNMLSTKSSSPSQSSPNIKSVSDLKSGKVFQVIEVTEFSERQRCSLLFWYADSLAASADYQSSFTNLLFVRTLLFKFQKCRKSQPNRKGQKNNVHRFVQDTKQDGEDALPSPKAVQRLIDELDSYLFKN